MDPYKGFHEQIFDKKKMQQQMNKISEQRKLILKMDKRIEEKQAQMEYERKEKMYRGMAPGRLER